MFTSADLGFGKKGGYLSISGESAGKGLCEEQVEEQGASLSESQLTRA